MIQLTEERWSSLAIAGCEPGEEPADLKGVLWDTLDRVRRLIEAGYIQGDHFTWATLRAIDVMEKSEQLQEETPAFELALAANLEAGRAFLERS